MTAGFAHEGLQGWIAVCSSVAPLGYQQEQLISEATASIYEDPEMSRILQDLGAVFEEDAHGSSQPADGQDMSDRRSDAQATSTSGLATSTSGLATSTSGLGQATSISGLGQATSTSGLSQATSTSGLSQATSTSGLATSTSGLSQATSTSGLGVLVEAAHAAPRKLEPSRTLQLTPRQSTEQPLPPPPSSVNIDDFLDSMDYD